MTNKIIYDIITIEKEKEIKIMEKIYYVLCHRGISSDIVKYATREEAEKVAKTHNLLNKCRDWSVREVVEKK